MRKLLAVALALLPVVAWAQSPPQPASMFLPEPSLDAAMARSAQQCSAWGCQSPPVNWYWNWVPGVCTAGYPEGTSFVEIEAAPRLNGQDFTATPTTAAGKVTGLTTAEQGQLVSYAALQADGCFMAPVVIGQ